VTLKGKIMSAKTFQVGYRFPKSITDQTTPYIDLPPHPKIEEANALLDRLRTDFPNAEWRLVTLHTKRVMQTTREDCMIYPARTRLIKENNVASIERRKSS
jgi:hypothetical protein